MNVTGFIRGYMAKNLNVNEFIERVLNTMSKEFEFNYSIKEDNEEFIITLGEYNLKIVKEEAKKLKEKGPFALDRYILDLMQSNGFDYDINRSQYIEYCNGIYKNCKVVKLK